MIVCATGFLFLLTNLYCQESNSIFYNTGNVYVKGENLSNATLYINGQFIADNIDDSPGCNIKVDGGKIVLIGNLYHNAYRTGNYSNVFSRGNSPGTLEFRGTQQQRIVSENTTFGTIPSKSTSYIIFPDTLRINNVNTVLLDARMAADLNNARMTSGAFILDSQLADRYMDYGYDDNAGTTNPNNIVAIERANSRTLLAHVRITGDVRYDNFDLSTTPVEEIGRFQINFKADPYGSDYLGDATTPYRRLYGLGSPFSAIRSDYFMFNVLILPDHYGFLGEFNQTELSPEIRLPAGRGFALGVDIFGDQPSAYPIDEKYEGIIDFDTRNSTGNYVFDRFVYDNPNNLYRPYDAANESVYEDEKIVTASYVPFTLSQGYNYLANPYLAPLSMDDLVLTTDATLLPNWNVRPGNSSVAGTRDIMNRVWILSPGAKAYGVGEDRMIYATHVYYSMKEIGGTYNPDPDPATDYIPDVPGEFFISPLQLFRIYSYNDNVEMHIPKSEVSHASTNFIRSSRLKRYDDFIFEVIDAETKTSDRICVVLRDPTEIRNTSADELTYKTSSVNVLKEGVALKRSRTLPAQSIMSLLYLGDGIDTNGDIVAVDEKILSNTTVVEPLYMTPSLIPQKIFIRGLRLNTMTHVKEIWLIDKKFGTKTLLTAETYYETTSEPDDAEDRFELRFSNEITGIDTSSDVKKEIHAYYMDGITTIKTFDEKDFGSEISIYDVQGKIINKTTVNDYIINIPQYLTDGVYVIKISGAASYVSKILVK
ncbi:MAG: T9SS type A sorting domain-containing protein [Candidatus Azobacteroides sp.]|nr:T9SS type A sorting domain-containing protein [Candidatus Azobacteroides sp.]